MTRSLNYHVRLNYLESGCGGEPSLATVGKALRNQLDYTGKLLTKRARERDGAACDAWERRMKGKYQSRQLVFIDETCVSTRPHPTARAPLL